MYLEAQLLLVKLTALDPTKEVIVDYGAGYWQRVEKYRKLHPSEVPIPVTERQQRYRARQDKIQFPERCNHRDGQGDDFIRKTRSKSRLN